MPNEAPSYEVRRRLGSMRRARTLRRLALGLMLSLFAMTLLNGLSYFVRSTGDPGMDGIEAIGVPELIWQRGGISGATVLHLDRLLLAIACTLAFGITLGLFSGRDLERVARRLRLPTPTWPRITLKTLLLMQLAAALVVAAGVTGVASDLINPLIVLAPAGGWLIHRHGPGREIPYAGALVMISAFACIVVGAVLSPFMSVVHAIVYSSMSWMAQWGIFLLAKRATGVRPVGHAPRA